MSMAVGIDLGTTNSCVAYYNINNAEVVIIENEEEEPTIPSFVYYDDDITKVGKSAEQHSILNPSNGIFDSKRMLGHQFDDKEIQNNLPNWPFKVTKAANGEPQVEIKRNGNVVNLRPEEVSAEILTNLKKYGSIDLGEEIVNAVITVPAYFTYAQRQATKDAAKIAGLNVLKLINEPTAAALNFIVYAEDKNRTVLVYDLGGGTFDVSLIKFDSTNQWPEGKVLSISGDSYLGGRDFDNNLFAYFLDEMERIYKIDVRDPNSAFKKLNNRRVRTNCEQIKKILSESNEAYLTLEEFLGHNINIQITRKKFENLNEPLFRKTIEIVDQVIVDANITIDEIDDVVLVGGSTRIPKIQQMVRDYFGGKVLNKTVNPDEAVARGAALQAALLNDTPVEEIDNYSVVDVTPFSLGIEVVGKKVSTIIERNTQIPASVQKPFSTSFDNQADVRITVYEGESENIALNTKLGEFTINGVTPKPKGEVQIDVSFDIDLDGILNVKATESSKSLSKNLSIVLNTGRLTEEEIEEIQTRDLAYHNYNDDDD